MGDGEVIKTILTADGADMRAEFAKSAAVVKDYQAKLDELRRRSLERATEEIRALQLETAGRKAAGAAVRESLRLGEEALRLSKQAGITEEAAMALLQKRSALQRQLAADAERAAGIERQIAAIRAASEQRRVLTRTTDQIKILELEAAGQKEAAEALRQSVALKQEAYALAKQTGLSEEQALALLQKRTVLERQIAIDRARQKLPISLGGLPVNTLQVVDVQNRIAAATKRSAEMAGSAMGKGALGFLAFSQAVEDAQYGIRGVLNNIPQMVLGFGYGAGLAGAISLAAVAAATLGPLLYNLYKDTDLAKIKEAGKTYIKVYDEELAKLREIKQEKESQRRADEQVQGLKSYAAKELATQDQLLITFDRQTEALQRRRKLSEDLAKLAQELALARIGKGIGREDLVDQFADEDRQRKLVALQEDLTRAEQNRARLNVEHEQKTVAALNLEAAAVERIRKAQEEIERLQQNQASSKANVAALQGLKEDEASEASAVRALADAKKRLKADGDQLKMQEALAKELENNSQSSASEAKQKLDALSAQITASQALRDGLREQITLTEQSIRQAKEQQQLAKLARAQAENEEAREERKAKGEAAFTKYYADRKKAAEELKKRNSEMTDFGGELRALRLELSGRKDMADALRKELDLRKQAAEMADRLKISQDSALKLVRERASLERKVQDLAKNTEQSKIRRSARNTGARIELSQGRGIQVGQGRLVEAGAWRQGSLTRSGLRESAIARYGRERPQNSQRSREEDMRRYYERSINLQEEQIRLFNKIGVK